MKKLIVMESMVVGILLISVMFSTVVNAQPESINKMMDSKLSDLKNVEKIQKSVPPGWFPGWLIGILINIMISILYWLGRT